MASILDYMYFALFSSQSESLYSKTCVKGPLSKRPKIDFQDQLSLNAGQKYCRMLKGEHSAKLLTFIMLPFVIKIFVSLSLSGHFTQVLLFPKTDLSNTIINLLLCRQEFGGHRYSFLKCF